MRALLGFYLMTCVLLGVSTARADDTPPADAPQKPARFAVLAHPLAVLLNRGSFEAQWTFFPHHAIWLNGFLGTREKPEAATGGVEGGYRLYLGNLGPNGVFFGAGAASPLKDDALGPLLDNPPAAWTKAGLVVDAGLQHVFRDGFVFGAGLGLRIAPGAGRNRSPFSPRLLLSLGYAF
jgi:hypothetical protein